MSRTAVLTVHYNSIEDTKRCADSLSVLRDIPLLVVVDNSSQESNVENALVGYPNLEIIRSGENLGFGRGNNLGIRWILSNTDCEFIFLLNNDAIVKPDTIALLEEAMDAFPEAGIVSPRIVFMENPNLLWYGGGSINWYRGKGKVPGYLGPADTKSARTHREVTFISGCAMFIRRTVLEQVGGFDPRFFMYEEDLELCLRVQKAGWTLRYVPEGKVLHKVQGSQREKGNQFLPAEHPRNPNLPFFMYYMMKNELLNMNMHAKGMNALRFWLGFPLFMTIKCVRYALSGRWTAIGAMAKGIAAFLNSRNQVVVNELVENSAQN